MEEKPKNIISNKAEPKVLIFDEQYADLIKAKMAAGLNRDQAIEVIKAQLAEDAKTAPETKTPAK
jgi:hypothetical protein